jgi:UDP-GlcNAc:undecaprenyl-phosphate/decaprenyl-phosphate GlcNAc-1-phosphate transferase
VINTMTFLVAFIVSLSSMPLLIWVAKRLSLVDKPDNENLKIHHYDVPVLGGIGIFVATFLGVAIFQNVPKALFILLFLIVMLGLVDDLRGLRPIIRLLVEIVVGLFLVWFLALNEISSLITMLLFPLYILFVAGLINAVNMLDGMDGLVGGITIISCFGFLAVSKDPEVATLLIALAGATSGFLVFNFNKASIFMGDSGSYGVGFLMGLFALLNFQFNRIQSYAVLLLVGLPIIDFVFVIVRRPIIGTSIFDGDRRHLYDLIYQRLKSIKTTVIICWLFQIAFVSLGILLYRF